MIAAKGGIDPASWLRTADYILDTQETTAVGERVASYRVTNCGTDDPAIATILISAKQAENRKSKADKTYHLVFSFPQGENPSLDVLHAIEDELCAAIGLADHQRISAIHKDTDHLHVHVAINKVHPTGLQNIEPYYDKKRLMQACDALEIKYALQRTFHGAKEIENERQGFIQLGPEQICSERDSKFRKYLLKSYDISFEESPEANTFNDLRTLSGCGLAHAANRNKVLLPGDACSGLGAAGESSADGMRRAGNGHRENVGHKGIDIEAKSGIETLTGYVAREIAAELRAATSWAEIHMAVARHGLEANLRGAGLVFGDPGLPLWTKASSCGRDLSLKALSDRLGPYQPAAHKLQRKSNKSYAPRPRGMGVSAAALYASYLRERQEQAAARRMGLERIRLTGLEANARLRKWMHAQRTLLKAAPKGAVRSITQGTLRQQFQATRANNRQALKQQRRALFSRTSMPGWARWLTEQAESGNLEALAVLRERDEVARKWHGDLLTAERADQAKAIVMNSLMPKVRRDGSVAYRTVDGGVVIDRKTHVHAQIATTGAAMVALDLAAQKFESQPLIVEGSAAFRLEVAALAGLHGLQVTFVDESMEQSRQASMRFKVQMPPANPIQASQEQAPKEGPKSREVAVPPTADLLASSQESVKRAAAGTPAPASQKQSPGEQRKNARAGEPNTSEGNLLNVTIWVNERNALGQKISSIGYHRLWMPGDAGAFRYAGKRRMQDGSEVLLLQHANEVVVKPASVHVVAKAARWRVGQTVHLDARGRFIDRNKGVEL
ncbi:relaxase/mobilization nuclease domain-containing protein [Acidovorax sp. D4N7]|nr:relaxase/mobilization nuclease domain-containing protein [Acidovorax sp. D4N7]